MKPSVGRIVHFISDDQDHWDLIRQSGNYQLTLI